MDSELLVDDPRIEDGKKLIAELARDQFDVAVAFWARTSDEGLWFLYIGSAAVEPAEIGNAYGRVYTCLARLPSPALGLSEIKLIRADNPIAQAAITIRDQHSRRIPTKYQGKRLADLLIDEAYIYPAIGPMTRDEVILAVAGVMSRQAPFRAAVVTLHDGSSVEGVPFGITEMAPGLVSINLHEIATNTDRVIAVDDVANVQ